MGHIDLSMKEREMWNKLDMSFKSAGNAQQFKYVLNGMEDEMCECNTFKLYFVYVATLLGSHVPSSHLSISCSLYRCTYIIIHSVDSSF